MPTSKTREGKWYGFSGCVNSIMPEKTLHSALQILNIVVRTSAFGLNILSNSPACGYPVCGCRASRTVSETSPTLKWRQKRWPQQGYNSDIKSVTASQS